MRTEPQAKSVQAKSVQAKSVQAKSVQAKSVQAKPVHRPNSIPVVTGTDIGGVHQELATDALRLRRRAASLRARSASMEGPLRISYRRRASELMLQAWLLEVRSGLPFTDIAPAA